ncbi:MAG: DoxX family protein [Proteobacteria bacterium]|nr:DoxX family protein [Pseudomonadota bacterium]
MKTWENSTDLIGRVLIAAMFLFAGIGKISGYAGTQGYMQSMGVPGALLPLVIALEVLGAIAIMVAGGFLFLVARGAGGWSLDARRERLTSRQEQS